MTPNPLVIVFLIAGLAYIAAGFVIRIAWSKLTDDERMLWKVAFFIHAIMLGEIKVSFGPSASGYLTVLIAVGAGVHTYVCPQKDIAFGEQFWGTFFGSIFVVVVFGVLHETVMDHINRWFK